MDDQLRAGRLTKPDARRAIDAVWRTESPRLIAGLTRVVGDVGLAEERELLLKRVAECA